MDAIHNGLITVLSELDWTFIAFFILGAYCVVNPAYKKAFQDRPFVTGWRALVKSMSKIPRTLRVLVIGIFYSWIYWNFWTDHTRAEGKVLFHSFLFAMVFHKVLLRRLFNWIGEGIGHALERKP